MKSLLTDQTLATTKNTPHAQHLSTAVKTGMLSFGIDLLTRLVA